MSLNNEKIVALLNRYYVPVFTSNEDYGQDGPAPPDERAELARIRKEGHEKKLSVGTVHVFLLAPDGRLLDTLHVAQAKPDTLAALLEKHARALGTPAGPPVVRAAPPAPPAAAPDALRLHLTARYLERRGDQLVPVENAGGNWSALPGEDWITLEKTEWTKLLPPEGQTAGRAWEIDADVAARLFRHFYPPTENNDLSKGRTEMQSLQATLVGTGRIRLDGMLRRKHPFYHKEDDKFVAAQIVGYLDFDPVKRTIRSLRMVTDQADYGGDGPGRQPFGIAVRLVR